MKTKSRGNLLAAATKAAGLGLALAAALIVTPGPSPRAQTERGSAKPREVKLGIKQRDKDTGYLQIKLTESLISGITTTGPAGTRSFKRLDKLTIPCKDEQKECKTVELESGILVAVCYCKDTQTALLLPAVQKVREAAARMETSNAANGHVKVFDGVSGAEIRSRAQQAECWGDEKLKLSICPQTAAATQ